MRFNWDRANVQHIARHGVTAHEAEEAAQDPRRLFYALGMFKGEWRGVYIGKTSLGRTLRVFVTNRSAGVRVVTAYDASAIERRQYEAQRA
ncbi:MAG: BrnT family toxin [Dehalococcoidia bacterium]